MPGRVGCKYEKSRIKLIQLMLSVAEPEQISKHFLEDLERLNSLSHEATA